ARPSAPSGGRPHWPLGPFPTRRSSDLTATEDGVGDRMGDIAESLRELQVDEPGVVRTERGPHRGTGDQDVTSDLGEELRVGHRVLHCGAGVASERPVLSEDEPTRQAEPMGVEGEASRLGDDAVLIGALQRSLASFRRMLETGVPLPEAACTATATASDG